MSPAKKDLRARLVIFYDHASRAWTAIAQDRKGNQIGEAAYGTSKDDATESLLFNVRGTLLYMRGEDFKSLRTRIADWFSDAVRYGVRKGNF